MELTRQYPKKMNAVSHQVKFKDGSVLLDFRQLFISHIVKLLVN